MPIYEYQCQKCGHFEVTQRITEKALGRCPTCKGKVKKLISNTSFQLRGTGWYVTDYARKDKSGQADKASDKSAKVDGSKSEGKKDGASAESKPAKAASTESSQTSG